MPAITIADLQNAKVDVDHISDLANSSSPTATDRLGNTKKTWAGEMADIHAQVDGEIAGVVAAGEAAAAAQAGAELARDASFALGPKYADEATGRAAVANGAAFLVVGSGDIAAYEYRRVDASNSTLIATYPAADAVRRNTLTNLFLGGVDAGEPTVTFPGYIAKTTGVYTAAAGWKSSDFIPVLGGSTIQRVGSLWSDGTSSAASIAFYGPTKNFLGYVNLTTSPQTISVADYYQTARYIRSSCASASTFTLLVGVSMPTSVVKGLPAFEKRVDSAIVSATRDHFLTSTLSNGYISQTGVFTAAGTWRTTDFIPYSANATYTMTGFGTSLVASVSAWDANFAFLGVVFSFSGGVFTGQDISTALPNVAYLRASSATTNPMSFQETRGQATTAALKASWEEVLAARAFAPDQAYALQGEALYLYARGILADRSVDVAWNITDANDEVCKITPASTTAIPVVLRAFNEDNTTLDVASFNVLVTGTPVNPVTPQNFICLGDSLTEGVSAANIQGAYVNELSRRLNGVGTALLSGAQSPAALALSNIYFRGTRGDQPVKHEGRGGWSASNYLTNSSVGGVTNAFWNPGTSLFDLDYYLTTNGFSVGSTASGVVADGSNLTCVILLGWNDVYTTTPSASAAQLGLLIDRIRATRAATKVIVVGLNPAPKVNYKAFTGTRYVSEREVFAVAVKAFGAAYKAVCAAKGAGVSFLQLSHVFHPEIAYATQARAFSGRSAQTVTGTTDHVHPVAPGYAQLADALFYKILYDYCR